MTPAIQYAPSGGIDLAVASSPLTGIDTAYVVIYSPTPTKDFFVHSLLIEYVGDFAGIAKPADLANYILQINTDWIAIPITIPRLYAPGALDFSQEVVLDILFPAPSSGLSIGWAALPPANVTTLDGQSFATLTYAEV